MNFSFVTAEAVRQNGELLVLPLFDSALALKGGVESTALTALDRAEALGGLLRKTAGEEGFKAQADQSFLFHTHGKLHAARVLLLGLGARGTFRPEILRRVFGKAAKVAQRLKLSELAVVLPDLEPDALPEAVRATVEGLVLGQYRFDRYRTVGRDEKPVVVQKVRLGLPEGMRKSRELEDAVSLAVAIGDATNWARDMVNEPAGVLTPTRLAQEATAMAKASGLKITVGGLKEIQKLKMGMFLGVTQGSAEEPRLIQVSYLPKNAKDAKKAPIALVGKAITFDSGGLSLKTADGMVDMKTDMAGSAAVLGAMRVIAQMQPPFPVHAFLGACENMPSGTAYRPGDILISRQGKTVEVTNTDAEGRLVLGDMLTWAAELEPSALVDLATLTGACMVALGHHVVGAFGDDEALMAELLAAAKVAGEELWRLPIHELQKDALKSDVADMKNSGERYGGAINAAVFLREFVGNTPWVHLDIAGPSQAPRERGYFSKGATGVGVRTLVDFIRQRASDNRA